MVATLKEHGKSIDLILIDDFQRGSRNDRSFSEIERWFRSGKDLVVSRCWIIEAWDNAHPEEIAAARAEGRRRKRGRFCHHSDETIKQIEEELREGWYNIAEIARRNGVSEPTVRRQLERTS